MKLKFLGQIFQNFSNAKFHENPSSGSRVVPCGRTDRRDMLIVALSNFTKASKRSTELIYVAPCRLVEIWVGIVFQQTKVITVGTVDQSKSTTADVEL